MTNTKTESKADATADPFRIGTGTLTSYGSSSIAMPLPAFVAKAMKAYPGDSFWYRVAPDNRSVTIYLSDPDAEGLVNVG